MNKFSLKEHGITQPAVHHNPPPAALYEDAIKKETGSLITSSGALAVYSGEKTGRSPLDKHIVEEQSSINEINWESNRHIKDSTFKINYERAVDYLDSRQNIYVFDGFAGWDPKYRIKVRVICSLAYQALFMNNMLIRPTTEELADFGEPDFTIINAGKFPANRYTKEMTSTTSIDLSFEQRMMTIMGTQYAGEMKKGVFTLMHFLMPKQGVLSMHCSANQSADEDDAALFFGLSGTGKTTLSADQSRQLIGDDEHCWSDTGVFNIEGGCYAKTIDLNASQEPEIFGAIRYGTVLENVAVDQGSRVVDFSDTSYSLNTRAAYPLDYIPNVRIPALGGHPKNIIFLTCDAFGVLPPVSRLTTAQAMYHFISGYTAKVAGTEQGITEPVATFSACFGAAFLVFHPQIYADLLAEKVTKHDTKVWLVNTGWTGGPYSQTNKTSSAGQRISLKATRTIVNEIISGRLATAECTTEKFFNLQIPERCADLGPVVLQPQTSWQDKSGYEQQANLLITKFRENFSQFEDRCSAETISASL